MELYLFRHEEFELRYNCSFYSVDAIPLSERRHPLLGAGLIALSVVFELLYLPCLVVISRQLHQSCYKFMFFIGVVDVLCIPMNGLLTGVLAIQGAVYCSYPTLIYLAGAWGYMMWMFESMASICLALNRCIGMASRDWAYILYDGNRAWLWLLGVVVYGFMAFLFVRPILFSGVYIAWFFNPHVDYFDDVSGTYHSIQHTIHNIFVLLALCTFYAAFELLTVSRRHEISEESHSGAGSRDKTVFVQVAIISAVNAGAAAIYVYMQFFPSQTSLMVIYAASYLWLGIHGMPPVIYLAMNKSIRRECWSLMKKRSGISVLSHGRVGPVSLTGFSNFHLASGNRNQSHPNTHSGIPNDSKT